MRAALERQAEPAIVEGETTMVAAPTAPPPVANEPVPPPLAGLPVAASGRHSSKPLAAAAVLVLGVVGGAAWWFLSEQPAPRPPPVATKPAAPLPTADIPPAAPPTVPTSPPRPDATTAGKPAEPPPAPPPDHPQVALASVDELRHQIAQWVSTRNCAMLGGDVDAGRSVTLSGLAGHGSIEDLRQGLASFVPASQVDWHIVGVNRVFCPTLTTLHSITPPFGDTGGSRLHLQMEGRTRLHDGEPVRVRLVMPNFPAWLRVDYVGHDGSVQHLYPQLADPKAGIVADTPKSYRPGETISLGNASWLIGPPYGTDMIIGVASSEPLFDHPRPNNAETADAYIRDLQAAIDTLGQRGGRVAGSGVTLEALP